MVCGMGRASGGGFNAPLRPQLVRTVLVNIKAIMSFVVLLMSLAASAIFEFAREPGPAPSPHSLCD